MSLKKENEMYASCAHVLCIPLLLGGAILAVVAAAPPPAAERSNAVSISGDGVLQRENATPWTPTLRPNPSNTTTSGALSVPIIVPIPGTTLYLRITYIGSSGGFSRSLLSPFFASAHDFIRDAVTQQPDDPVFPLPWFHSLPYEEWPDTVAIRIRGQVGRAFTWQQLDWVLLGVRWFMTAGGEEETGEAHPINFEVRAVSEGVVAAGLVWSFHAPPSGAVVERREARVGGLMV